MRVLHAIHDFLPRHRAGSEIYACDLCTALLPRHDVTVVCAEYDPGRPHGAVAWRSVGGLPVVEIVNNHVCASFEDTWRSALMARRLTQVLETVQPDVLHVHSLFNLSFDLPAAARARGVPVVATLHDYTLVCPAGGQRLHRADAHVCRTIDTDRCARCVPESPSYTLATFGRLAAMTRTPGALGRSAASLKRRFPALMAPLARTVGRAQGLTIGRAEIEARLAAARGVFDDIDLFVAPSPSIAREFERLGVDPAKIEVSDYGFPDRDRDRAARTVPRAPITIGFVGSLVWHKGVHVLLDAVRALPADRYEVKIFGDPDVAPEYAADLRARAAGLPVRFMGAFDRADVSSVYSQIDVLVVPSLWLENSPLVIHEAFMAGVPIVGAGIGGIADLVEDGRSGLLYEPASSAALAGALKRLLDDPVRLGEMAQAAPAVKSIAQDAAEWEARYDAMVRQRTERRPA